MNYWTAELQKLDLRYETKSFKALWHDIVRALEQSEHMARCDINDDVSYAIRTQTELHRRIKMIRSGAKEIDK